MLYKSNAITSGAVLLWYLIGAASGWKGWLPPPSAFHVGSEYSSGSGSGGHGSIFSGGWGGGK